MNLLFLSRWYPYPADNGIRIRIFNLIRQLATRHTVDLVSFTSEPLSPQRLDGLRRHCRSVEAVPYRPYRSTRAGALLALASPRPRYYVDTHSPAMQHAVERVAGERRPDFVVAVEIDMAPYSWRVDAPRLLDGVEVSWFADRYAQAKGAARLRQGLTWFKMSRYLARVAASVDGCSVVSHGERMRLEEITHGSRPIEVLANGVDLSEYEGDFGAPHRDRLVYAGALSYSANFDAVDYFLREIQPLVRAGRPQAELLVTGAADAEAIARLPRRDGVTFSGHLDDVRPAVAGSWVSVVPLRQGSGTRLKILESLALGTPVVATAKGAEGLDLEPGCEILIADTPADFAAAVRSVLEDAELRERLRVNGRRAVEARYDWRCIGRTLLAFVDRLARKGGA